MAQEPEEEVYKHDVLVYATSRVHKRWSDKRYI